MRLSVIGLGKLGAPMAAVLASKGYSVIGVDSDPDRVRALNEGNAPEAETGLAELIRAHRKRISGTTNCVEAVAKSDLTFVVVATPSGPDGQFSLRDVNAAMSEIAEGLAKKCGFHLVVLSSTVMPGSIEQDIVPLLERISGKTCGLDFGFCYKPEFIALGSVIHDMLNPDLVLIGESDVRSGEMLARLFEGICESRPAICRMNFVNAELTKLSINTFVTMKLSYANMLAEICERVAGADVDVITRALGSDSRIGHKYLTGATAYGGPCFPRDNVAFSAFANARGCAAALAGATQEINEHQASRIRRVVSACAPRPGLVAILGLSYKPNTAVVDGSQGIALAWELTDQTECGILVHDPVALDNATPRLPPQVHFARNLDACVADADVLVVMTPWPEYSRIASLLGGKAGRTAIVDCWRLLEGQKLPQTCDYIAIGRARCEPPPTEGAPQQ